ncbi:MAG: B12-binding domain-containing protein [bacterium]|nr:B12-binding domain-containing protein [bacterium]
MLRWCSYCQQFLGEVAPYENLAITHGVCPACSQKIFADDESGLDHALVLKGLQDQFYEAGRRNDLKAVERIIEKSDDTKIRAVDILVGVLAPLLYQVGEEWKQAAMTVAEEHRFTAFCEKASDMITTKVANQNSADKALPERAEALLINVSGNSHTLGIRILALWLKEKDISTRVLDEAIGIDDLMMQIHKFHPSMVLISVALAEQAAGVLDVVEHIANLPNHLRPRVIVGGYAVKQGLISAIPGAELVTDISSLLHTHSEQRV